MQEWEVDSIESAVRNAEAGHRGFNAVKVICENGEEVGVVGWCRDCDKLILSDDESYVEPALGEFLCDDCANRLTEPDPESEAGEETTED